MDLSGNIISDAVNDEEDQTVFEERNETHSEPDHPPPDYQEFTTSSLPVDAMQAMFVAMSQQLSSSILKAVTTSQTNFAKDIRSEFAQVINSKILAPKAKKQVKILDNRASDSLVDDHEDDFFSSPHQKQATAEEERRLDEIQRRIREEAEFNARQRQQQESRSPYPRSHPGSNKGNDMYYNGPRELYAHTPDRYNKPTYGPLPQSQEQPATKPHLVVFYRSTTDWVQDNVKTRAALHILKDT